MEPITAIIPDIIDTVGQRENTSQPAPFHQPVMALGDYYSFWSAFACRFLSLAVNGGLRIWVFRAFVVAGATSSCYH